MRLRPRFELWVVASVEERTEQAMRELTRSHFLKVTAPAGHRYKQAIDAAKVDDVLVFVHDDVYVNDWLLGWRMQDALMHFDVVGVVGVVGVAGNRRRQTAQETWHLQPGRWRGGMVHPSPWDRDFLIGSIMHGDPEQATLIHLGPTPAL